MPFLVEGEIEDQTARRRDEKALVLDAKLSFGKNLKLAVKLFLRPWFHAQESIAAGAQRCFRNRPASVASRSCSSP